MSDTAAAPAGAGFVVARAPSAVTDRPAADGPPVRWGVLTRIAFRCCALYFPLYIACTQMFGSLFGPVLELAPFRSITPPQFTAPVQAIGSYIAVHCWRFLSRCRRTGAPATSRPTTRWRSACC